MRRVLRGSLVSVGGHRLHAFCAGDTGPSVVFEAALAGCHAHWAVVQDRLARSAITCSYDRAGLGWSEPGPAPRTAARIARELQALLAHAGIPTPRVMVGHSFGSLPLRVYASLFPSEVGGLVLLDPMEPDEWIPPTDDQRRTVEKGLTLCRRGAFAARIGLARIVAGLASAGSSPLARRAVSMASRGGFTRRDEHILAPFTKSPRDVQLAMHAMWTQPKCFEALADEIRAVTASVDQAAAADLPSDLPVAVLSAGNARPSRIEARDRLVSRTRRGRHTVVSGSSHWIQLDRPDLVVDTIWSTIDPAASSLRV